MAKEVKQLSAEKQLAQFIVKNVVPGAGDVLTKLKTRQNQMEMLIDELQAYVDGRAYDKETGLPWQHRLEHTIDLIDKINKGA